MRLQDILSKTDVAGNAINPFAGAKTAGDVTAILENILNGPGVYTATKSGKSGALFNGQTINPEIAGKKSPGEKTDLEREIESGFLSAIKTGIMDSTASPSWWDNTPAWWGKGLALKYEKDDPTKKVIGLQPALASGGIVLPRRGGTSVTIGEAGQAEAVIPLSDQRSKVMMAAHAASLQRNTTKTSFTQSSSAASGDVNVNVTINESDNPDVTAQKVLEVIKKHTQDTRRRR